LILYPKVTISETAGNHHAMFDLGIPRFLSPKRIEIEGVAHNLITKHELLPQFIEYHNSHWQTLNL